MQRLIITSLFILLSLGIQANDKLVLTKVKNTSHLHELFENQYLSIHYYDDRFVIASTEDVKKINGETFILDEKAFSSTSGYYIVYSPLSTRQVYLTQLKNIGNVLFENDVFLIVKPLDANVKVYPAKNDGMVFISQRKASLPQKSFNFPIISEIDTLIRNMTVAVNTDSIMSYIQHLQNYGTRVYFRPQAYEAQDWIAAKFEAMRLDVEIQEVIALSYHSFSSSGNVIAVQKGTVYPNEYVVVGAHYDSWSSTLPLNYNLAPGADDNASGTAAIIEMARILSQSDFKRSIIYVAFSAEEVGLFGSKTYASRSKDQKMNILGYFNMDMIGYLKPGESPSVSLISPSSAKPLADYYINIADIYFPNVLITQYTNLSGGGDSDHTSFNQNGYMGIYPFEHEYNYSPFIHSANDIIGPSVNNPEQCRLFTQITFASIVTLAEVVNWTPPVSTKDFIADKNEIIVYPNPTTGYLRFTMLDLRFGNKIEIFDMNGTRVYFKPVTGYQMPVSIDISHLPNGVYIAKIGNSSVRIVKNAN
jgi:leucyl aminopeptidase